MLGEGFQNIRNIFFQFGGASPPLPPKSKEINKTSEKTCSDRSDLSKQVFQIFLIFQKVLGLGGQGGGRSPLNQKKNCLMFFLQNFRERKADSDQNVLREESVFLRYFEESGRKLKKKIKIFFFSWGPSTPCPPPGRILILSIRKFNHPFCTTYNALDYP